MIKIKDLHKGDIIYNICKYHWIEKIKIISELIPSEYQTLKARQNNKIDYYIKGLSTFKLNENNFTNKEDLDIMDEGDLYKTYNEAKKAYDDFRKKRILYLQRDNNLLKELYTEAIKIGRFTDADKEIYKELINNCKVSFNNK